MAAGRKIHDSAPYRAVSFHRSAPPPKAATLLDLVLNASDELRKIPQTSWYRLQRLVETAPTAFLVLTRASIISSAQLKLSLDNAWSLADLEQDHLTARLKILLKRAQGG